MAGQTIHDRFLAARHSIAGQGLAKAVCKATTEEMISPKKKHLDYLINCTNEPNVSIPQLATLLIERSQNTNWVVVFKSLLTTHHLMCNGNERFTQFMASNSTTFQLNNFLDKGGVQGYDMSSFIRRYAAYLNEKAMAYRIVAFDFCKVKRGKEDGVLRTMGSEKLLKTLPALQNQLDALLEFNCTPKDLTNSVIHVCFMFLFRDLIRLFACYNDAIINLLEKFFDMNKKQSREALELYKKFLIRMDRVGEFLRVAENIGIDKGDIPDLTKAPSSLLDALEQHILTMEGKKGSSASTPVTANNAKQIKSGMSMLSSTSTAFGTAATNSTNDGLNGITPTNIDEALRQRVLAEEEAAMNQYKSKVQPSMSTSSTNSSNSSVVNNPFLTPSENDRNHSAQAVDLFTNVPAPSKASDDLLQLSNPFADAYSEPQPVVATASNNLFLQPQVPYVQQGVWLNNGFLPQQQQQLAPQSPQQTSAPFVSESTFSTVFGNQTQNNFDALGNVLQPVTSINGTTATINSKNSSSTANNAGSSGVLTGDLESSLASLAENLSINNRPAQPKGVPWNSPGKVSSNWTPQPMAATNGAGYKPMGQGMTSSVTPAMSPSLYQPQVALQTVRPMPMGMMPTMGMNVPMSYPTMGTIPPGSMSPNVSVLSTQIPQQSQQSLLFH